MSADPSTQIPQSSESGLEAEALSPVMILLAQARRLRWRIWLASAALLALAALIILTPCVLAVASTSSKFARPFGLVALLSVGIGFLWQGLFRGRREVGNLATIARLLAQRIDSPQIREGLLPAVELDGELTKGAQVDFSPTLARAHIASVGKKLGTVELSQAVPRRPIVLALRVVLIALVFSTSAFVLFSETMSRGARFLTARDETPKAKTAVLEPITGEVELTYLYPSYTRLASRTVTNTNGEISAPKGTQVQLRTHADREVAKALLIYGELATPMEVRESRDLSGGLLVRQSGSYRFRFVDKRDRVLAEGPPIPIAVEEDARPKATIVLPMTEVEVDPKSRLTLRYDAEDDYGLSEIALLFKLPGANKPERVMLQRAADAPRRASGEYSWDLGALGLLAGDTVSYYIEAIDNDEVSGKKAGVSKTQYLKIYSEAEHHKQIIRKIEENWEQLITLLADRLESPELKVGSAEQSKAQAGPDQTAIDTRAIELAQRFGELAQDLRKSKSPEQLWRALINVSEGLKEKALATAAVRSQLTSARKRGASGTVSEIPKRLSRALETEIAEEEKDILYLETLLDQQRIEDLVALSKELAGKRRELAGLLEKYRTAPDESTRDRLIHEIARLKERMAELAQRMSELSKGLNDEHINSEALAEMSRSQQMMGTFDKIQEMLHQGKVEDAMKEMEKLGQMLDGLEQSLQKASKEFKGGELDKLGKDLANFANSLDRLEQEEKNLLGDMRKLRGNYKKALEERLAQKGPDLINRMRKKVEEARQKLSGVSSTMSYWREDDLKTAKEEIETLDKALIVKDYDQAAQSSAKALSHAQQLAEDLERQLADSRFYPLSKQESSEAQRNAKNARGALPPLQELAQEMKNLFPAPSQALSEADKQQLKNLSQRQNALQSDTDRLKQRMGELNDEAPIFSPDAQEMLKQAGARMGKAQNQLQARNPTGATAEAQAALDQLSELKKGLQKPGGKSGNGSPVPWPWVGRDMPSSGQDGNGNQSPNDEEVKIPGADQYQAPEEYRRDILDAMKQGTPEKYKEPVKRYYEEIVK